MKRVAIGLVVMSVMAGCASENQNAMQQGAIGAATGAGIGMMAGNNIKGINRTEGAIAGAAIGGLLGTMNGHQSDQNQKMQNRIDSLEYAQQNVNVVIANSNGSSSVVTLRRNGTQYIGPRGEIYNSLPSQEQLKPIYGF